MGRLTACAVSVGVLASAYVAACVLPGEPSGARRIQFTLASATPYRVPLAGIVEPPITISADGRVLTNPPYRLETLDAGIVRVDSTERRLHGVTRGTAAVRVTYLGATGTPDTVFPVQVVISRVAVDSAALGFTRLGARTLLRAIALDANDAAVPDVPFTWSSAYPAVAVVNDTGLVTAVNEGATMIIATADGVADSSEVTVTQVAAAVRMVPKLDTLRTVSRSTQFLAIALDESNAVIRTAKPDWSSSDEHIARIDTAGLAIATGAGTAKIVARVGLAADTAILVVKQVARFVVVVPGLDTLIAIDDTSSVGAIAKDSLGFAIPDPVVTWASSDPTIATVDQMGLVRAAKNGVVLVTASSGSQSAFATVVVRQEVAAARVTPESVALTGAGDTVRLSAVAVDRNGYPVAGGTFAWRSDSWCVAEVDFAGLVTAGGEGSAAIIATDANGGSDTAVVSVAGAPPVCRHAIAFQSDRDGNTEIYVMDADGSDPVNLTNNPSGANNPGSDFGAVWSPDGTRIAFGRTASSSDSTWNAIGINWEIYVMNADGSGLQNVTNDPRHDYGPRWSPDGTRILFTSDRDGNMEWQTSEIYVMNADGSGLQNVTNNPGYDYMPAWSPDGTRIAFTRSDGRTSRIYVMNADGSGVTQLATGSSPAWSPDGTKIVFSGICDGNGGICVINADGSGRVLVYSGPYDFPFVWSPDGTRIAFSSNREGNPEIYVINADGSGLINITNDPGPDYVPAWNPTGTKIAFSSYRDPHPTQLEVYLVNADGSGLINITNNPGQDWAPVWRPR